MRTARVDMEVVAEFRSRVLATRLFVYTDCVEGERVSNGRLRREVIPMRDVAEATIEPVPANGLVTLTIRGLRGKRVQLEMTDPGEAERARHLIDRLRSATARP